MDYPINDIFEGVGELLGQHGEIQLSNHDIERLVCTMYVRYSDYTYRLTYCDGVLTDINRIKEG